MGRLRSINYAVVFRVVGWLVAMEGLFLTVPLITSIIYSETDWKGFAIAAGTCLASGTLLSTLIKPHSREIAKREGFLLTALVWIFLSGFGMLPFMLCEHPVGVSDAYFEAMSGFTTTGASVIPTVANMGHGMLIWRAEMNWIGGMGIILFTLAVVPMLNHTGGMQMFNAEVTGITHEKLRPRISQTAKNLWLVYVVLTIALVLLLWAGPMNFFESVCHGFSTISTGGFSTRDGSVGAWDSTYIDVVITVFMLLGGVNFAMLYLIAAGRAREAFRNEVLRTLLWVITVFYVLFVASILIHGQYTGWKSVTIDPLFLVVSTITSTGLTVNNFENWGPFVLALVFFLMFFGSCAGSTSGGAKLDRLIVLIKTVRNEIYKCVHSNSVLAVRVNDKVMAPELVSKVIAFLCLYVLVIAVGGAVLTMFGIPVVDSFFSAFSCVGNTGLGAGVTGYGGGYEILPDPAKWVLSLIMLTGRLEIFTVLILLSPGFWRK